MNKSTKKIINYIIGPVLFIWLSITLYYQIKNQPNLLQSWDAIKDNFSKTWIGMLVILIFLMLLNWILEGLKWKLLLKNTQCLSLGTAFKAVLIGQAVGLSTFYGLGSHLGKMVHLKEENRSKSITLSIIGSLAQVYTIGFIGMIVLFLMSDEHLLLTTAALHLPASIVIWGKYALLFGLICFLPFYFHLNWIERYIRKHKWIAKWLHWMPNLPMLSKKDLLIILLICIARYAVFMVQYLIFFRLFEINEPYALLVETTAMYLLLLIFVPTIPLAELGFRGEISKLIFGIMSTNILGIVLTIMSVWMLNIIVPSILGTIFILRIKWFQKNIER